MLDALCSHGLRVSAQATGRSTGAVGRRRQGHHAWEDGYWSLERSITGVNTGILHILPTWIIHFATIPSGARASSPLTAFRDRIAKASMYAN